MKKAIIVVVVLALLGFWLFGGGGFTPPKYNQGDWARYEIRVMPRLGAIAGNPILEGSRTAGRPTARMLVKVVESGADSATLSVRVTSETDFEEKTVTLAKGEYNPVAFLRGAGLLPDNLDFKEAKKVKASANAMGRSERGERIDYEVATPSGSAADLRLSVWSITKSPIGFAQADMTAGDADPQIQTLVTMTGAGAAGDADAGQAEDEKLRAEAEARQKQRDAALRQMFGNEGNEGAAAENAEAPAAPEAAAQ